jgi:hypothetical protein
LPLLALVSVLPVVPVPDELTVLLVVLPGFGGAAPPPRHEEAGPGVPEEPEEPEEPEDEEDEEAGGGGMHRPGPIFRLDKRGSDVVPDGVAIWAEVALALPGHQATNHPSATVATTSWPSSRARVTPVTPDWVLPSTSV